MVEKLKLLWSNIYDRGLTFLGTLGMIFDVMPNRLRFIGFMRIFFTSLVIEIGYPNSTWRKGRKTGKVPACNPRIWEFGPKELLAALFEHSGSELTRGTEQGKISVACISFLVPRVTVVVVPKGLPKAGLVLLH